MSTDLPVQGKRIVWCLRHYAWLVVACMLACAAAPLILAPAAALYQADALVVARQLTADPKVLPRLAEAVFTGGAVEAAVAADPAIGGATSAIIPERLSLVAAQDSVVLVVQARDRDPATAARLANLGATAFVDDLNRGGAGVGEFALQAQATVPTAPLSAMHPLERAAIGALAGLALGLGLVALAGVIRRPVVTSRDVQESVGIPLLGTVHLPRVARGAYPGPLGVPGIATVTRWIAAVPPGRLLFISPPSAVALRQRIYVMVAVALSSLRGVQVEAPRELVDAVRQHRVDLREAGRVVHPRAETDDQLILGDGGSALEIVGPAGTSVSVVAVAPLGIAQGRLRALAADYTGNGLLGLVLVEGRPGFRRAPRHRAVDAGPPPVAGGDVHQPSDVPEPERA